MQTLPSPPPLYAEVIEVAQSPDGSLDKIGEIIQRDIGMTAKILQLVNSAFFGLRRPISNPVQAVRLIGLQTVKARILAVQIFRGFDHSTLPGMSSTLSGITVWPLACVPRVLPREKPVSERW
jgi:HD-like signal output (HDOD) protein